MRENEREMGGNARYKDREGQRIIDSARARE